MKSKRYRVVYTVKLLSLLYVFCILLGYAASYAVTIYGARSSLLSIVRRHADDYMNDRDLVMIIRGESALLVDADGHILLEKNTDAAGLKAEYREQALRSLPRILSPDDLYLPIFTRGVKPEMLLIGTPLLEDGAVKGAFFLIRPIVNASADFLAFFGVFTLVFVIGAGCVLYVVKRIYELEEMRGAYVANISHDLKSPVASIKALTETMSDGLVHDEESLRRYYEIILSETDRLDHAIKDLLELSKMQSYQVDFSKASISANLIFDQICEKFRVLCADREIVFHVSESIAALPELYTNAGGVVRLLEILLDNALKFTKDHGGIWLEASRHSKGVAICVRDDGAGISKDALPHVFERFYKEDQDYASTGNGLGLAIAREIVLALGEEIWVKSEPGKGAAFYFTVQTK